MTTNSQEPKAADIAALDAALAENFKAHFSVEPFLSRKIVSFQGNKDKPAFRWYKYKEAFSAELVAYFLSRYDANPRPVGALSKRAGGSNANPRPVSALSKRARKINEC